MHKTPFYFLKYVLKLLWIEVDIPPKISLKYVWDFVRAKIIPIYKSLEKSEILIGFIEKDNSKINDTKIWTKRSEIKFLIHTLKNQSELFIIKLRKANGLNSTKIWSIIYLSEKLKIRFIRPADVNDFIIPSKENKLKSVFEEKRALFKLFIKFEKLIFVEKRFKDKSDKPLVMIEIIFIICSHIQKDEFINETKIIVLKINCFGESIFE